MIVEDSVLLDALGTAEPPGFAALGLSHDDWARLRIRLRSDPEVEGRAAALRRALAEP